MLFYRSAESASKLKSKYDINSLNNYYNFPITPTEAARLRLQKMNSEFLM